MRSWRSLVPIIFAALVGCSPDSNPTAADGPAFSHTGIPDINGVIFSGAGRRNICSSFQNDPQLLVRVSTFDGGVVNAGAAACPDNGFTIPVEPGSYFLRLTLPFDQPRGRLPLRWLETAPVDVEGADVFREIHVRDGVPLGGGARVDGVPTTGVIVTALYQSPLAGAAGQAVSSASGIWEDAFQGGPLFLQGNVSLGFSGCVVTPVPGIRQIDVTPGGSVLFPTEANALNCDFLSGDALQYTHRATRLKLSSFPGDIGGVSDPMIFPEIGYGYSAQFPLAAGAAPVAGPNQDNRQLFRGGLVLAVAPDLAISGVELEGYAICAVSPCRSLGFDGQATVNEMAGGKREVTWTYSDAGSQRPRGLRVVQRSFDGQNGDYVLYALRITNQGPSSITFTPGLFMDFDVSPEFFTNTGYTELSGQLMVTTTADDLGRHFGTVVLDAPAGGRSYFFSPTEFIPESDVVAAIRGEITRPAMPDPDDVRLLQGGTTVKLGRKKSTDVWVAIVAGDSRAQVVENARAAIAEAAARRLSGNTFTATGGTTVTPKALGRSLQSPTGQRTVKLCKRDCVPD